MAASRNKAARAAARDARAKDARTFINKTLPALLKSNTRARRGVEAAEVIVDPPPWHDGQDDAQTGCDEPSRATKQETDIAARRDKKAASPQPPMRITLRVADTLEAASRLRAPPGARASSRRVGVLNMASPLRPGGGVLSGATSQEESLCARTTLYPSLRESFYRLPDVGGVFTPDVLVCRRGRAPGAGLAAPGQRFFVDVVTAAMLRMPDVEPAPGVAAATAASGSSCSGGCGGGGAGGGREERVYAEQKDRELALRKMRAVMRILRRKGVDRVVLGAWGCGAYGNPVGEVARAWRTALCGGGRAARRTGDGTAGREGWDGLEVVFAIADARMAAEFAEKFGPELVVEEEEDQEDGQGNDEDSTSGEDGQQDRGRADDEEQHPLR